jgi:hypothetical protein
MAMNPSSSQAPLVFLGGRSRVSPFPFLLRGGSGFQVQEKKSQAFRRASVIGSRLSAMAHHEPILLMVDAPRPLSALWVGVRGCLAQLAIGSGFDTAIHCVFAKVAAIDVWWCHVVVVVVVSIVWVNLRSIRNGPRTIP